MIDRTDLRNLLLLFEIGCFRDILVSFGLMKLLFLGYVLVSVAKIGG